MELWINKIHFWAQDELANQMNVINVVSSRNKRVLTQQGWLWLTEKRKSGFSGVFFCRCSQTQTKLFGVGFSVQKKTKTGKTDYVLFPFPLHQQRLYTFKETTLCLNSPTACSTTDSSKSTQHSSSTTTSVTDAAVLVTLHVQIVVTSWLISTWMNSELTSHEISRLCFGCVVWLVWCVGPFSFAPSPAEPAPSAYNTYSWSHTHPLRATCCFKYFTV